MKKIILFTVIALFQCILFIRCDNFCTLEPPPYGYQIMIDVLDKNTGRTLIASRDTSYYVDSAIIEAPRTQQTARMAVYSRDTILVSEYIQPGALFRDTIYFKYRNTKVDTLVVYSHSEERKACGERFPALFTDKLYVNGTIVCDPCNNFLERIQLRK